MPNNDKFIRSTNRQVDLIASKEAPLRIRKSLEREKGVHINNVINDKVCQELNSGPSGSSQFLPEGDLFSFMGFNKGDNPVGILQNFLENNIIIKVPNKIKNFNAVNFVFYPSDSDFESNEFALPWGLGSWVNRVENGIPNLSRYVSLNDKGRSSGGLQLPNERKGFKGADFKGVSFMTRHKKAFFKKIQNLKNV